MPRPRFSEFLRTWWRRHFGPSRSTRRRVKPIASGSTLEQLEPRVTPTVSFSISDPAPLPEGDSGTSNMVFVVTRSGDTAPVVQVDYTTQNGTGAGGALAGTDYTAISGTLLFAANQTTATISVPILGNAVLQGNRTFGVVLSDPLASADFTGQQTFAAGIDVQAVVVGDVNGDGLPDLVVVGATTPATGFVSVLLNTTAPGATTPAFATQQTFAVGADPFAVTLGDVNGDGKPDILTANGSDNTVSVLLNTTSPGASLPSFAGQQPFATGLSPRGLTLRDVNGDGKPDLIVTNNASNTVSVLLNTTAPGATAPAFASQQTFAVGTSPDSVAAGDVNGDGRPDLVVTNYNSGTVSVLLNTTAPGSTPPSFATQQTFATGASPVGVALGDINDDGKADLTIANYGSNSVSVLLNTTAPGATTPSFAPQQTFAVGNGALSVALGDVNADGKPDLLVANEGDFTVSVLLGTMAPGASALTFAPQQTFAVGGSPRSVALGDLNGDGLPDLVTANGSVSVLLNAVAPIPFTPSFASQTTFAVGSVPYSVAVGDINGDGRPDLAVANRNANTLSVLLNQTAPGATTPAFASQTTFAIGNLAHNVVLGDVNGDGLPDLVVGNAGASTVSVLLNQTAPGAMTPAFATQQTFTTDNGPIAVQLGDVNGDGLPDIITANNAFTATVSVLLNQTTPGATTPAFSSQVTFATGAEPYSVALGDVNGDGKPDLIVANNAATNVSVLLNTTAPGATTPSFATQQTFATGSQPISVALGDINGDGKPDIAVANETSYTAGVLLNTTAPGATTPSFGPQQTFPVGMIPFSVALGDINGDGRPDLVVANLVSNTVSLLLNTTAPGATTPAFATQQTFAVGDNPPFVALADVNGDFQPDLLVVNRNNNNVGVLLNNVGPRLTITTATATGTIRDDDAPVTVTAATGNNQSANVNTAFATALAVDVTNAAGHLVQGVSVTFSAPGSGASGTFGGSATVTTDASGRASAPTFTANATPGSYTVTATASGGSNPSTAFNLTNLGPPASITITSGDNQSTTVNTAFATALKVVVKDSAGNALRGVSVTFTPPGSGASGSFSGSATVTTDTSGIATAPTFTANAIAGSYNVTAKATGGNNPSTTFALTNTNLRVSGNVNITAPPGSTVVIDITDPVHGTGFYSVNPNANGASPTLFDNASSITLSGTGLSLTVNGHGNTVVAQPGSLFFPITTHIFYGGVTRLQLNDMAAVNSIAGPDTADRSSAFTGLSSNQRFVQALYLAELGRAGSVGELAGWATALNHFGAATVASGILHSAEARDHLVRSWYVAYLGRSAQGGEEQGLVQFLLSGGTEEDALSLVLGSAEFFARAQRLNLLPGGSADQQFVQALYTFVLGRTGGADELNVWVESVPRLGRVGVARQILQSSEARTGLVEAYYNALLHRPDDRAGLNAFSRSGADATSLRIAVESSAEFFSNG